MFQVEMWYHCKNLITDELEKNIAVTARNNRNNSWWLLYPGIEYLLLFLGKHANKKYFFHIAIWNISYFYTRQMRHCFLNITQPFLSTNNKLIIIIRYKLILKIIRVYYNYVICLNHPQYSFIFEQCLTTFFKTLIMFSIIRKKSIFT